MLSLAALPMGTLVVDLRAGATIPQQVAVLACSGLFNRNESVAGAAYTLSKLLGFDP